MKTKKKNRRRTREKEREREKERTNFLRRRSSDLFSLLFSSPLRIVVVVFFFLAFSFGDLLLTSFTGGRGKLLGMLSRTSRAPSLAIFAALAALDAHLLSRRSGTCQEASAIVMMPFFFFCSSFFFSLPFKTLKKLNWKF